jgi:carbamoyl-phosphate synthase large subunit
LRGGALRYKVAYTTTLNAAFAACQAHAADDRNTVTSIQELHKECS